MLVATALALSLRVFTLTRPGFLTQSTEYDDGVYLGAAIRASQGVLPYRSFAFVQPPGILLLMAPAALFSRWVSTVAGLGLARMLTMAASTACVPLAGRLVRYRGSLVTTLTCGFLAIYPPDIATAHTLLLEPWMNVACLLGANFAFRDGRLAGPRQLAYAGALIGFAGAVKYWAIAPAVVLLVVCLASRELRWRRPAAYAGGVVGGFLVTVAPFLLLAPAAFFRSTIIYQAARVGTGTPVALRLAHVTGLIDIMNYAGNVTILAGGNSLFADSAASDTAPANPQLLPVVVALVLAAIIVAGYLRGRTQLEWFALATAALALAAILCYSAFFYHYAAFPGPWLAIVVGVSFGQLILALPRRAFALPVRALPVTVLALVLVTATIVQLCDVAQVKLPTGVQAITKKIPPGACVLTDEASLTIAANRFYAWHPGCPVVIDSLATTLVFTHGVSIQAGADSDQRAVTDWQKILMRARYVWLSPNQWRRLPWPAYAREWFHLHFWQKVPFRHGVIPGYGQLYERRTRESVQAILSESPGLAALTQP
jgi:alpha-1,2-mannosyltransferase